MGEVDHEARVLDQAGDLPFLDVLIWAFMLVEIFFIGSRGRIHRTADHLRRVPVRFSPRRVPIHVHYKWLSASVLDGLHNAPDEHRMDGQ